MWVGSGRSILCAVANEELGTLADNNPLTIWRDLHFLVTLLFTYFVTSKVFTIPHDAPSGTIARGVCPLRVSKSKAGLHVRLAAEQVLVSGWEIVVDVHGHLVAVFAGHETVELRVPGVEIPPRAGGGHLVHCLHVNVVPLCVAA